jgi:hypothetical protein
MKLRYWRNWWGLRCRLQWCFGDIDYDKTSTFWRCADCGRINR